MAIVIDRNNDPYTYGYKEQNGETAEIVNKYLGTSYILTHKADFEPGRSSDFILKIKFARDLYDMEGNLVADKDEATETLALSIRDYTGPQMSIEPIRIKTGNGTVSYAGVPSVADSSITFTDYIGKNTEAILLAWYSMAHNILNDKIGFKEYYSNDGILYKWAPNGTRQISWWLLGCWINDYNMGQFSRQNPDLRQFSTTIIYDKPIPYAQPNYTGWEVGTTDAANQTGKTAGNAYDDVAQSNYIGTQTSTPGSRP